MQVNTLVRHKKMKSLGIGCVSKLLKGRVKVNFGEDGSMICPLASLQEVDVSRCKTMSLRELQLKSMNNSFPAGQVRVIIGNEVKEYVGIGWTFQHIVTEADLLKYPRIV